MRLRHLLLLWVVCMAGIVATSVVCGAFNQSSTIAVRGMFK